MAATKDASNNKDAERVRVRQAISDVVSTLDGFSELKKEQTEALEAFVCAKDVLAVLPTGFGKSIIYQIAPLVFNNLGRSKAIVIVVSPLVSLIEDQIREAEKIGVRAAELNGSDDAGIREGKYQLVFGSPERFLQEQWRDMISSPMYKDGLVGIVVDEVHLTYKWGQGSKGKHAFRESFACLGELRSLVKEGIPILALTASADMNSTQKVLKTLNMKADMVKVLVSPNRQNIRLSVVQIAHDKYACLEWIVKDLRNNALNMENIIIYCRSIKTVGKVFNHLKSELGRDAWVGKKHSQNLLIGMYHSATLKKNKDRVVNSLLGRGACKVVVATTALGMGVNFKNVSKIVLFGPPEDTEDILQMIGRAGRDGRKAHAVLYFYRQQMIKVDKAVKDFVDGKNESCIRKRLFQNFEESPVSVDPGHDCCSNCHRDCSCSGSDHVCPVSFPEHESFVNKVKLPGRTRDVNETQCALVRELLEEYKDSLTNHTVSLFTTDTECTGFSDDLIDAVVEHCCHLFTLPYVNSLPVYSEEHAKEILLIISEVFGDIEDIDEQLGEDISELQLEEQESFDYSFSGYFDEGLVDLFDDSEYEVDNSPSL